MVCDWNSRKVFFFYLEDNDREKGKEKVTIEIGSLKSFGKTENEILSKEGTASRDNSPFNKSVDGRSGASVN